MTTMAIASAGVCWFVACDSTQTRLYLSGPACLDHTPWAIHGHRNPADQVDPTRTEKALRTAPTPLFAKGGTDIDKDKPGGYVSAQRAQRQAQERDAVSTLQHPERATS